MENNKQLLPLICRDMNRTFQFVKRASPYCLRLKEVGRKNSLMYSVEERNHTSVLLCQGANLRLDSKVEPRTIKFKHRLQRRMHNSVQQCRLGTLDISPWENDSP